MRCILKKLSPLPEWFDIENYRKASNLNISEWYANLHRRFMFFELLRYKSAISYLYADYDQLYDDQIENIISQIKSMPVITGKNCAYPYVDRETVRSLRNGDLIHTLEGLQRSANEEFLYLLGFLNVNKKIDRATPWQPLTTYIEVDSKIWDKKIADSLSGYAVVNLSASDEQIISDFKAWIEHERKKRRIICPKKSFKVNDCNDWADFMVLPYLDLKIWSKYTGKNFTQAVIGYALFPEEIVDTTEKIRKSTKPKADFLMKSSTIKLLGVQVKNEIG